MVAARRFPDAALLAFTRDALAVCGIPQGEAATAAKALIEADLTGFDAHGIFRLSSYVANLRSGRINPKANIKVVQRAAATALVDGDNGMGHLVMSHAANLAVELARQSGVGWVGARRSNHAGAAGVYAEIPLAHGMAGIYAAVSTANHMAPWGGAEPLMGTNPIAVAIPAGKEAPVVLDIATSVASFGTIRQYALSGTPMPEGWVVHRTTGEPVTDPKKVSEGVLLPIGGHKGSGLALVIGMLAGVLLPIGGHKGSGLALVIGMLAGVLNGAAFGRDVIDFTGPGTKPSNTGQFVIALDVARFMPLDQFAAEVDRHLNELRASRRLPGFDAIRLPGEERRRRKADRSVNGVELAAPLIQQLDELAASLKIEPLATRSR